VGAASNPHKLGVGLVTVPGVSTPLMTLAKVIDLVQVRQYNVVDWWNQMSNGAMTVTTSVSTGVDIFSLTIPATGTSCASWSALAQTAFRSAGGTGVYDSYIWIFQSSSVLQGCQTVDVGTQESVAALGPCVGGCQNILFGTPYINAFNYVIGRNKGLTRSDLTGRATGDLTCIMGSVLTDLGSQRRGFNALKLRDLGLISSVSSPTGVSSFSQFLSAIYMYDYAVAGSVKLLQLDGTQVFLSYRAPRDWKVDRSVNWGYKIMASLIGSSTLAGVTHVHLRGSDGTTVLLRAIGNGVTYAIPDTSYTIRQDWNTDLGAQLSITKTGVLPTALAKPATTLPSSGTITYNAGNLDTAEQGGATTVCYGASTALNMCWAGDDRNNSCFMRLQVNVPAGSTVSAATLVLESDVDQLQSQQGTTLAKVAAEVSLNPQTYTGNLFLRQYYASSPVTFTGNWYTGDEAYVDVTSLVQKVVSQANFAAGNFISLVINSAVVNQQLTRTAQSGSICDRVGGATLCGPRIKITYASGNSGQPAPTDCVYSWTAWSVCAADPVACGSPGTQTRNLIVITAPANNGAACPTPTRQSQSCTTSACVVVPKDCVWSWSAWSDCAGSCSSFGSRTRTVIVTQLPDPTGVQCPTVRTETDNTCQTASCPPVDCLVDWSPWGLCTGPCGSTSGSQSRTGIVSRAAQYGGVPCPTLTQSQPCTTSPCVQNCVVTYSVFSACVGPCGTTQGSQQKTGTVQQEAAGGGTPCPPLVVVQACTPPACAASDCVYSWSYSACVGTCGGATGTQTRTAIVTQQAVGAGAPCPAPQQVPCVTSACTVAPTVIFPFAELTTSGTRSGTFNSVTTIDGVVETITESSRSIEHSWMFNVPASSSLQLDVVVAAANPAGQQMIFQWAALGGPWVAVQSVRSTTLQRYIVTLSASSLGAEVVYVRVINSDRTSTRSPLSAVRVDYLAINAQVPSGPIKADCFQGVWVESLCSLQCGTGTQTLSRPTLQQPHNGGVACGPSSSTQSCSDFTECPTDCVVSGWSGFSACSATCGTGTQTRTRTISVNPRNGGAACPALTETVSCQTALPACSGSCVYGPFTPAGSCSVPCGGGTQVLTRTFTGSGCTGSATSSQPCNTQICPGTSFQYEVQASLATSGGSSYQAWSRAPTALVTGVSLVLSGRATDLDATLVANGYWQLVRANGAPQCAVTAVTLTCPTGATVVGSVISSAIGKVQCANSLGLLAPLAAARFSIQC
jgi:hypothetical protein